MKARSRRLKVAAERGRKANETGAGNDENTYCGLGISVERREGAEREAEDDSHQTTTSRLRASASANGARSLLILACT